ncbi:MAG: DNA (cytosine-5-)-methyltransferase [Patescibacteria group bacterium]|nr:DNA (cytosine-5-)-methyltransferase [Patescibacteria group bacterium]
MEKPKVLDLFSGIGGFSYAFEQEGFSTIGFSEVEPFACQVLKKHWPKVTNYGDITKWRDWPDLVPDVVCGGFPCQPFSQAGKRRGASDDRFLWPAMLDVIARYQPTWVVGENVANFVNMELDNSISDLEKIGYEVQPFVVPACAVGFEHKRERIWIIGNNNKVGFSRNSAENKKGVQSTYRNSVQSNRKVKTPHSARRMPRLLESPNCGIIHGLPSKLDVSRIAALGNSIVPQIAQEIARCIYQVSYA